jgi:hypothetical protein
VTTTHKIPAFEFGGRTFALDVDCAFDWEGYEEASGEPPGACDSGSPGECTKLEVDVTKAEFDDADGHRVWGTAEALAPLTAAVRAKLDADDAFREAVEQTCLESYVEWRHEPDDPEW